MRIILVLAALFILAGCETYTATGTVPVSSNTSVIVGVSSGYYHYPPYVYNYYQYQYFRPPIIVHRHIYVPQHHHRHVYVPQHHHRHEFPKHDPDRRIYRHR